MRQWNKFPDLIELLIKSGYQVIVIGQKKDHAEIPGTIDLVNQTTIQELVNLIKRSNLVVTSDSGSMHIAFALARPTVALFGPIEPNRILPLEGRENITVIYNAIKCSPCTDKDTTGKKCKNVKCMDSVTVNQVFDAIKKIVARN